MLNKNNWNWYLFKPIFKLRFALVDTVCFLFIFFFFWSFPSQTGTSYIMLHFFKTTVMFTFLVSWSVRHYELFFFNFVIWIIPLILNTVDHDQIYHKHFLEEFFFGFDNSLWHIKMVFEQQNSHIIKHLLLI